MSEPFEPFLLLEDDAAVSPSPYSSMDRLRLPCDTDILYLGLTRLGEG